MNKNTNTIISILLTTVTLNAFAFDMPDIYSGYETLQLGVFKSNQGEKQHINKASLIGDTYTVKTDGGNNALLGLGYFLNGINTSAYCLDYGLNGFYFYRTPVSGHIILENVSETLKYNYNASYLPIYATAKTKIKNISDNFAVIVDAGIGPDFIKTQNYNEKSIDNGVTIPTNTFLTRKSVSLSANAGIAISLNNIINKMPIECGYRFFYLGEGKFRASLPEILTKLKTGNSYSNALLCSASFA